MRVAPLIALVLTFFIAACKPSMTTFPNDENGDVLRRMQAHGDDLSQPRDIEFDFVFSSEKQARDFATYVRETQGLKMEPSRYEERKMWQTKVTKFMVPTHQDITAFEITLTGFAQSYGGEPDGWGCFQVDKK